MSLTEWILLAALHFAPPSKHPDFPGHEETVEEATARYELIANDIAGAVAHWKNRKGAKNAAALALAFAIGETGLTKDADVGPCFRGKYRPTWANHEIDYKARCDSGKAATIWQFHATIVDGERLEVADLFADRARAAKLAIRFMYASLKNCAHLKPEDRLSGFGIGRCVEGNEQVRKRWRSYERIKDWKPAASSKP